jgi:hypothetical protein
MRKLARARDCLSLLVLSTRAVYIGIIMRNFSWLCLSLSVSFCYSFFLFCVLASINCGSLPFHPILFACSSAFSYIFFIRIVPKTPFSLAFSSITSIMRFYPLSCNRANDRKRRRRRKKKRKAVAVVAIIIVRIYLDRFFLLSSKKKEPNSSNNYTNKKLFIAY